MNVIQEIETRRETLNQKYQENSILQKQAEEYDDKVVKYSEQMQISIEGLEFLESIANGRRNSMKGKIESSLTEALQLVYGSERRIEISYNIKNNRSNLIFELVKETKDGEVRRTLDGSGSGLSISDIVSVPLRLLVLLGSKQTDRICVLDECYRHVDNERIFAVSQFLKTLTDRLGIQVLLLSHHEGIRKEADKAYQLMEEDNKAIITYQ